MNHTLRKQIAMAKSLPPTTTAEENVVTAGQRAINKVWEITQAVVAMMVTIAFLFCEIREIDSEAVRMAFTLVIGFYFSRTNHTAIGGIGKKPEGNYIGR